VDLTWEWFAYGAGVLAGGLVALLTAAYSWFHLHGRMRIAGSRGGTFLLLGCVVWAWTVAAETFAPDAGSRLLWFKLTYAGRVSVPLLALVFGLDVMGRTKWLVSPRGALLLLVPLTTTALVWTNDAHGLMWTHLGVQAAGPFTVLIPSYGAWFPVHILVSYGFLAAGTLLVVQMLVRAHRFYRWQARGLLLMVCLPWLADTAYIAMWGPIAGVDFTPITFVYLSVMLVWTLSGLRVDDIMAVSHGTVVQIMSDAVLVLDGQDRLVYMNPAAERILAHSTATSRGLPIQQVWPEWTPPPASAGEDADSEAVIGVGHTPHTYDMRVSTQADWRGRLVSRVVVLRDITARKRLEEQLLRAQRLETAGLMAGQVAHDFNNLLAPMAAYPELIKSDLPEGHPAAEYCDAMLEAAKRMAAINEDMMALGRRGHFDQQAIDLGALATQTLGHLSPLPAALRIDVHSAEDVRPVVGSRAQLARVITNLVTNAREAVQDRGTVTVAAENVHVERPTGHLARIEEGDYVRLVVSDTGCGIAPEILPKIFEPFFTTKIKARRRGCGLGLSIVQAVVADHGGRVDVSSEPGKGTTFSVYLPAADHQAVNAQDLPVRGGHETILVVDDDNLQREVSRQVLTSLGYQVETVACGEDALTLVRKRAVDLLVLDMVMPGGMDGAQCFRRVRDIRPSQKAIIVSGFSESDLVRQAQALGAGGYLRKPLTRQKLAQAVRAELDRSAGTAPGSGS
jgi:signal transduction histidine kinase/ActR/RegA family two-component response regulator